MDQRARIIETLNSGFFIASEKCELGAGSSNGRGFSAISIAVADIIAIRDEAG